MHQIDEAQEVGYEESEIVSSVIRAMIPSLTLRKTYHSTNFFYTWKHILMSEMLQTLQ